MNADVLKPGLLRAIEVVKKFEADYRLVHDTRKRFDLRSMQRVVDEGFHLIIEDLEVEAGLREPWNPDASTTPPVEPSRPTTPNAEK